MSMLEVFDMVKELGYNSPQEIYWQSPSGVLNVNPLKTDSDVLSMLATMPRNKYAHVYLQEIVDEQLPDSNVEIIRDAEISEHVETVRNEETIRNVETKLPNDAENVRNVETELSIDAETVRNTESEDEDTYYVGSESICTTIYHLMNAGGQRWEVSAGFEDQHVVDLEAQTCNCRKWDLTGIPCIHVAFVILHIGARPEDFVNPCYRKETQLKIYSHMVKPLRGPKQWSHYQTDEPILPPVIRRPIDRPQTKRRKEPDEPVKATGRLAKLGVQMTCSKCGSKGHNKGSCRGQVGGNARAGRNARPSMSNTSEPMPTAHASQSSTMPTARATTSKLSVRRKTCYNSATSSHPSNSQHHQQGSESTLGPPMLAFVVLCSSSVKLFVIICFFYLSIV
ncbi:hypothetical protein GQ457_08G028060 [Hibiscus cannabinus]